MPGSAALALPRFDTGRAAVCGLKAGVALLDLGGRLVWAWSSAAVGMMDAMSYQYSTAHDGHEAI